MLKQWKSFYFFLIDFEILKFKCGKCFITLTIRVSDKRKFTIKLATTFAMDRILGRLNQMRVNWWQALKKGISIKGYTYYKPPPEIKYRYPAPGSCPINPNENINLFKMQYKTPYRESPFNIQPKELRITDEQNVEMTESAIPELDPNNEYDRLIMREQLPNLTDKKLLYEPDEEMNDE